MATASLERTRIALKFSLWTWAAYWPAMGVMLLASGMRDPVSMAVALLSLSAFFLVASGGALRASSSRNVREFLVERPIYLVAAVVLFLIGGSFFNPIARAGMVLFAGLYFGGLAFLFYRLVAYARESGRGLFGARVDQPLLVLAMMLVAAFFVLFDAFPGAGIGNSESSVAILNWLNLGYPVLILVATRGLREPLAFRGVLRARPANVEETPVALAKTATKN
jgi:hypothetical protein